MTDTNVSNINTEISITMDDNNTINTSTESEKTMAQQVLEDLDEVMQKLSTLISDAKEMEVKLKKIVKAVPKVNKRRVRRPLVDADGNIRETNLTKKLKISDDLSKFMNIEGGEASRTEIVKAISEYAKGNNLKLETDRRTIIIDQNLSDLLNVENGSHVRFCDVQKHVKHHLVESAV